MRGTYTQLRIETEKGEELRTPKPSRQLNRLFSYKESAKASHAGLRVSKLSSSVGRVGTELGREGERRSNGGGAGTRA